MLKLPDLTRFVLAAHVAVAGGALALPALADSPFATKTGALSFDIDSAKSQFKWDASGPAEVIKGTAEGVSGSIKVANAADASTTSGSLSVPVARMRTGNAKRDEHLQGPEWLNSSVHPNVTFAIQRVEGMAGGRGTAVGSFTLNGVSKPLSAPVEVKYAADKNALKVTTTFKVSLKDYNVKGKAGFVGNKVGEVISVEAVIYATGK